MMANETVPAASYNQRWQIFCLNRGKEADGNFGWRCPRVYSWLSYAGMAILKERTFRSIQECSAG